jgi:hypothetical protein
MFISVDLPLPDAPTIAIISPLLTSRSRPWSATTSRSATLKIFTRLSQLISAPSPYLGRRWPPKPAAGSAGGSIVAAERGRLPAACPTGIVAA